MKKEREMENYRNFQGKGMEKEEEMENYRTF